MFKTLINVTELSRQLNNSNWVIVDCRHDLMQPSAGHSAYIEAHIPGAVFADIKNDLSGPPLTDHGRHPLPSAAALTELFTRLGIDSDTQVVAYDASEGSFAARLWWLLNYMGHEAVAVLDGGWPAWTTAQHPVTNGEEHYTKKSFVGVVHTEWLVMLEQVPNESFLVDSRDPARYRGEVEPVDPAAGHIPGAINRFWKNNLQDSGLFKPADELLMELQSLYTEGGTDRPVFYCGSGVTACHNLLAVAHAGLTPARLYAGSWSEWCSDPVRPIAKI